MARESLGHVELVWTCPNCGTVNPGPQKVCSGCGAPQPDDVKFEAPDRQEIITDKEKAADAKAKSEAGADIHCGFCGARNPAGTEICTQCGANLKEGTKREHGQVVGALRTRPAQQIKCPTCGALNPDTAHVCAQCGASLAKEPAQPKPKPTPAPTPRAVVPQRKTNPLVLVPILLIFVVICGVLFWVFTRRESTTGFVSDTNWERKILIEELGPVERSDWFDTVPADARNIACEPSYHHTQDSEPATSGNISYTKTCGTPYVVDEGTGYGEAVQDCTFDVYWDRCSYVVDDWRGIDQITLTGQDLYPLWPDPALSDVQRIGGQDERYNVTFSSDGTYYDYATTEVDLYTQFEIGSEWALEINPSFNSIISVEPIR